MFFMLTSIESKKIISWNKHKLIIKTIQERFCFEKLKFSYFWKVLSFLKTLIFFSKWEVLLRKIGFFICFENFIIFQNFEIFQKGKVLLWEIDIFIFFENFIIFSTFWRTHPGVENKGVIEHGSWNSQKIQLQYNIKGLNASNSRYKISLKTKKCRPLLRIFAGLRWRQFTAVRYYS